MAEIKTYFETGSLRKGNKQFNVEYFKSVNTAKKRAAQLSKDKRIYVTVMKNGLDYCAYLNGVKTI